MAIDLTTEQKEIGKTNFQRVVGRHYELSRRDFMKGMLAAGTVLPISAAAYFGYQTLHGSPVKAGLIGAVDQSDLGDHSWLQASRDPGAKRKDEAVLPGRHLEARKALVGYEREDENVVAVGDSPHGHELILRVQALAFEEAALERAPPSEPSGLRTPGSKRMTS